VLVDPLTGVPAGVLTMMTVGTAKKCIHYLHNIQPSHQMCGTVFFQKCFQSFPKYFTRHYACIIMQYKTHRLHSMTVN